jgi:ubiquinone biosynthesis protein
VLGFFFLWLRLSVSRVNSQERAIRIRRYIERQGGVWIKIGQLFASRRDILPEVYCDELERLTDSASAFPPDAAQRVIEESLGGPLERFFDVFDPQPLAAASIGQVHRARLRLDRVWVAVKVKRPHIASVFDRDLALVGWITRFLKKRRIAPHMRWDDFFDELETMFLEELDYRIEASSGDRLRKIVRKHGVYAPKVFLQFCTSDVLVMEFVDGVLMSDYIRVRYADPAKAEAWCEANNIQPRRVAFRLFETIQRQVLEEDMFHADLHPGNLMLLKNSRIALIDFGSAGTLEGNIREQWLWQSAWQRERNYVKGTDMSLQIVTPLPPMDVETFVKKLARLQRSRDFRTAAKAIPYEEKSSPRLNKKISQLSREYQVPASWDFIKHTRTFFVMETSIRYLDPQADFARFTLRYQRRAGRRAERQGGGFSWLGNLRSVLVELPKITRMVSENVYFNSIILRREAKAMQIRSHYLIHTALTLIGTVIGTLILVALSVFIHKAHDDIRTGAFNSVGIVADIRALFGAIGYIDYIIWAVIILLMFNTYRKLRALKRLYLQ